MKEASIELKSRCYAEVWVAAATLAVAAGSAAYSGYNASQTPDDSVFGKKPKVAPFVPIDLSVEQGKAAVSNLENADSITALLDRLQPGFSDILREGMETSGELVRGELPQDVQEEIMRSSAFQSLMNGFGGTGMGHSLTARDIGRTSLDMFQAGTNAAQAWSRTARDNYQPFLITTDDQVNAAAANNAGEQRALQNTYNVAAAPDPAAAGQYNVDLAQNAAMQQSLNQFASILSSAGRQYNQSRGGTTNDWYSNTGGTYIYDPSTGSYKRGG